MSKKKSPWQKMVIPFVGGMIVLATGKVFADWWGYNAPPCSNGHCAPVTPWGYTPPHWHRWPAAIYPDMIKPASAPAGEEVAPPSSEVPPPNKEAEMQTAPPMREPSRNAEPQTFPGPSNEMLNLPTPARQPDQAKPSDAAPMRDAPGAQPPTIDPFAPPSGNEPGNLPPGRSSAIPKVRVQAGIALPSSAFMPEKMDLRSQRWTSSESREIESTPPVRVRMENDRFSRAIVPDQEPDLLIPALSTRPLAASSFEAHNVRGNSGNPLRTEFGASAALPATYLEPEPAAVEEIRAPASQPLSTTTRANPLRR